MAQLSETFPTLDCSQCILTPKMVEARTASENQAADATVEIEEVSGYIGNFKVRIRQEAQRYVDPDACNRLWRVRGGMPAQHGLASSNGVWCSAKRFTFLSRRRCPRSVLHAAMRTACLGYARCAARMLQGLRGRGHQLRHGARDRRGASRRHRGGHRLRSLFTNASTGVRRTGRMPGRH